MTGQTAHPGKYPADWAIQRIDEVAQVTTGSRNTQDRADDGLYPFFVRSQTVERINSWSYDGEAVLTAGDGVGTGKVFHYIKGKFDCHQRVYRIADFDEAMDGFFFFKQFSQNFYDRIMSMTAKSSVDSVRREMIAGMDMPAPPIEEQKAIAQALSDIDDLIASLDALIAKKRDIKQGMMQQLLTGKRRLPGFSGKWTRYKVAEAFDILRNGSHARSAFREDGEVYCAHYGAIHATTRSHVAPYVFPRLQELSAVGLPLVQDGDLLLADASEDLEGIGKSVEIINCGNQKLVAGLHTILLRPKPEILSPGYVGYLQFTKGHLEQWRFWADAGRLMV